MAEFLVRNSLNPNKVIKLGITYLQLTPKDREGEAIWACEINTDEPAIGGGAVAPVYIDGITRRTLDEEISKAVAAIAAQVDWTPLVTDRREPIIEYILPSEYEVDIDSFLEIGLQDHLPAAGIDLDSISMTINDFDVTNELQVSGDPYRYKIKWNTFLRIYDEE
jgi:hypothetical protein